jgi:hypothetical protein
MAELPERVVELAARVRTCPDCAEIVRRRAATCRFCGAALAAPGGRPGPSAPVRTVGRACSTSSTSPSSRSR